VAKEDVSKTAFVTPDGSHTRHGLVQMEAYEHPQSIFFNLHFWNPHILQSKNFVEPNEKFCPMGVKTEISRKRKYDFSCPCPHFYVIKNNIYTYHRKCILDLNKNENLYSCFMKKSFGLFFDDVIIRTINCKIL